MTGNGKIRNSALEGILAFMARYLQISSLGRDAQKAIVCRMADGEYRSFLNNLERIIEELLRYPQTSALSFSTRFDLSLAEIAAIYKIIQISDAIQQELMSSRNSDYINISKNHFDTKAFEVVFFVGLSCPLRCVYCPSIKIHADGRKTLKQYRHASGALISKEEILRVFEDIKQMKKSGIDVLVKISGGLEPFTNIEQIGWILDCAQKDNVPTKIFTNGILLNCKAKRSLALRSDSVRISLSTPNQNLFKQLCLTEEHSSKLCFHQLKDNIRKLLAERSSSASPSVIGLNSVIGTLNWMYLEEMIDLAVELEVDYIDIKPDYFGKDRDWVLEADPLIAKIRKSLIDEKRKNTRIFFAGSINGDNVFNDPPEGTSSLATQCKHKIFITPYGECSPVHYGAFPNTESSFLGAGNGYCLGKLSKTQGIIDLIAKADALPNIPNKLLNPYERILAMESKRREEDDVFGLPPDYNPYDNSRKDRPIALPLPDTLSKMTKAI